MAKSFLMDLYKRASLNMASKNLLKTNLLYNKVVLYVIFIISLLNLLIWVVSGDNINIILFLLIGFLTSFFSKNMIVILLFALVVSNIVKYGTSFAQEGFDNKEGMKKENDELEGLEEDFEEGLEEDFEEGVEGEQSEKQFGTEGMEGEQYEKQFGNEGMEGEQYEKRFGNEGMEGEQYEKRFGNEGMEGEQKRFGNEGMEGEQKQFGNEGMRTLAYSFTDEKYAFPDMIEQQNTLLSNISTLNPYLVMIDNESKIRSQMKYSEFTKQ
jgi:hypothetical protein